MTDLEPRYMEETMGGEVKKQIIQYRLVMFNCTCKHLIESPNIMGYEHKGGYKDATGKKWWLFVHCPKCKYDWALHKIGRRVVQFEKDTLPAHYNRFYNDMRNQDMAMRKAKRAPSPAMMYLLFLPNQIDIVPLEGFRGRSPIEMVKPVLAQLNPDAYVCCAEGWFRRLDKKERENWKHEMKHYKYGEIQKMVDRKECLTVNGSNKKGDWVKHEFFTIARDGDNNITDFVEDNQEPELHSNKLPGLDKIPDEPFDDLKKKEVK